MVANRLSENPNVRVLLLEAGDDESILGDVPMLANSLTNTDYIWKYPTEKQSNAFQGSANRFISIFKKKS